ncbi:hypothetical protein NBRC116492_11390 [Aurantivibrio infirmus]
MRMPNSSSYFFPVTLSVGIHSAVLVFMIWGWTPSTTKKQTETPRYIPAELVQMKATAPKVAPPPPKKQMVDNAADRKKQEEQKKRQEEIKRKQADAQALKQQQQKEAKEKAEKERLAKEQAEKERLAKAEQERQREEEDRKKREEAFSDQLEQERALMQAQENEQIAQSFVALIDSRVKQNWSIPPSARNGMTCELIIQLIPNGQVINVTIAKSSGNDAFDRSAQQAVRKADRFPELRDVSSAVFEQNFRQFRLVFRPEDLRQ